MADFESRKQTIKRASQQVAKGGIWLRPASTTRSVIKRESVSGRFIEQKRSGGTVKGVRREK
jgi:hypothetical protein